MTTMNGAKHDVEDILASIRTSIADRSPFEVSRRESHVTTLRGRNAVADEAMEFELPAIFKPSQPTPERPNLLGRLSEALASNAQQQDWDRARTVIPFEPVQGRMIEPPPPVVLEIVKENPAAAVNKIAAENDSVSRVMPTFFDTRMNRMAAMAAPEPPQSEPVAVEAQPPRLPGSPFDLAMGGGVEDAAAQLLRPILKEWLSENMPKIVEKALRPDGK